MCKQIYETYLCCPCQTKAGEVEYCDPRLKEPKGFDIDADWKTNREAARKQAEELRDVCPFGVRDELQASGRSYCRYHRHENRGAKKARRDFFHERGRYLLPHPQRTPVLGRAIGGRALRCGAASETSKVDFPRDSWGFMAGSVAHGEVEDPPGPYDEKLWDLTKDDEVATYDRLRIEYFRKTWAGFPYWKDLPSSHVVFPSPVVSQPTVASPPLVAPPSSVLSPSPVLTPHPVSFHRSRFQRRQSTMRAELSAIRSTLPPF
ncbi:hypothetical protein F4819DRAFT_510340 [Hypoxylon fuscum]|nr:hypothetical protein F4819DRAFT_510340 [Hypoxylon fuscum]